MNMKLRKLKECGIVKMNEFLDSLTSDRTQEYPENILSEPTYSESVADIEVVCREFNSKYEIAEYLFNLFIKADLTDVVSNKGLWCWLSLYYFKQLCPKTKGGKYNPGARPRWIPELKNFQRYYRHLLAGPYRIYYFHRDYPERALAFLCGEISKQGDLHEQIASRQELITNKQLIEATTRLYYEPKTGRNKRGAGGKDGGSPRRIADVIDQFNLTWDLYSMSPDEIINLLPHEFDRFRNTV